MDALSQIRPKKSSASRRLHAPNRPALKASDQALLKLGQELKAQGYKFTTISPASHRRVNARRGTVPPALTDIFGWSRTFVAGDLSEANFRSLADAGALEFAGGAYRSSVRFSTLGDQIFVHSAFPTQRPDAVFFGPDSYRFARFIQQSLGTMRRSSRSSLRILDVGAGSGAGGLHAAALLAGARPMVTLTDINPHALRFCRINADLNGARDVAVIESDLF